MVAEFTARWEAGEPAPAEEYLDRLDSHDPGEAVELIYREYCLAESMGLDPVPSDFLRRFPDRNASLERLFQLHGAFGSSRLREWAEPTALPEVGDEIGPYVLLRELGRGSFARVFLAEQSDLDHRLVVAKIATRPTLEPRLLARARHSNIVEVLWHGSAEDGALQLICMPFLGGATLATVLAERRRRERRPRSGRDLLDHLDRVSAPEYPKANLSRPARELMERVSYPKAMAWVVARLAEALDHAYGRGVAHGDVKPSNILVTADGNPMLLDFNLAVGWHVHGPSEPQAEAGGTLAYMAPERLRAVAETGAVHAPTAADRHRADIFSLGVVLLEALTGRAPELLPAGARSREDLARMFAGARPKEGEALAWLSRTSVPGALRPILARCLAPDPADRYGRAAELAEDLDRWRTERPLAFAEEPRWRSAPIRWARRQRLPLAVAAITLAVAVSALLVARNVFESSLREQAVDKLALIWDRDESGAFRFQRFSHWRPEDQGDPAANALHQLERYDVLGRNDWRQREDVRALPERERAELEIWLLEQVLRYTRALSDRPDSPADWHRALAILERVVAETPYGPLETQIRTLQRRLGVPKPSQTPTAQEARISTRWKEEYLRGVEAEPTRARDALEHYQAVLKDRPESFWTHYRAATVAYRLGDFAAAAAHLRRCIAQRLENPALRAQLSGCLFELNRLDSALEECNRALILDPDHAESTWTRTLIRGALGQEEDLKADFHRFELLAPRKGEGRSLRLRLGPMRILDTEGTPDPDDVDARVQIASRMIKAGHSEVALSELDRILDRDPDHLQARYIRAQLLRKRRLDGADRDFSHLLAHPRFEELLPQNEEAVSVYHHNAGDLMRAGKAAEAVQVAQLGLVQADRFRTLQGQSHYTLARAFAVAAKTDARLVPEVVSQLQSTWRYHPKFLEQWFERDALFDELRAKLRPLLDGSR